MTILNAAAINVRTTRYSDMISSITPLTRNLKLAVEDLDKKQLSINVETIGNPAKGYVVGDYSPSVNITTVTGAASKVSRISSAVATVDVSGRTSNMRTGAEVVLYDGNGDPVNSSQVSVSVKEIVVDVDILETKEISVSAAVSGTTAEGFAYTGLVSVDPQTVVVAGTGSAFKNLESIVIPAEDISIEGIAEDKSFILNINDYLPSGIRVADSNYDGALTVTAYIGKLENALIDIPTNNIFIDNIPEGFTASFADDSGTKRVEVQGLNEELSTIDVTTIMGSIDASSMTPREPVEGEEGFHAGSYDAYVKWNMPQGITVVGASMMEITLSPVQDNPVNLVEGGAMITEMPPAAE
jgi:YbbR domain-containing protein